MIASSVILNVALVVGIFYALREIFSSKSQIKDLEDNLRGAAHRNDLLSQEIRIAKSHKDEIFWAAKAKGESKGTKELMGHIPQLYDRFAQSQSSFYESQGSKLAQFKALELSLQNSEANYQAVKQNDEIHRKQVAALNDTVMRLSKERDEFVTQNRVLRSKLDRNRGYQAEKPSKSVNNGFDTDSLPTPSQDNNGFKTTVRPLRDGLDTAKNVYEYEDSNVFAFEEVFVDNVYVGRVKIIRKSDGMVMGQLNPDNLNPGIIHYVGSIMIVLCALDGCYKITFAQQSTKKCCSRDHANQRSRQTKYAPQVAQL